MFEINEYVVYGNSGVCKITGIGKLDINCTDKEKLYYTLEPVYEKEARKFVPVEKQNNMRKILSKQEVDSLIEEMPFIETRYDKNPRKREEHYRNAFKQNDCREYARIIKTLYLFNIERKKEGKNLPFNDIKYLHMAEDSLFGEFAIPLEIPKDKVEKYILDLLN